MKQEDYKPFILNPNQQERVEGWMVANNLMACPKCNHQVRIGSEYMHKLPMLGYQTGMAPVVAIVCPECAFVEMYSASVMGLIVEGPNFERYDTSSKKKKEPPF